MGKKMSSIGLVENAKINGFIHTVYSAFGNNVKIDIPLGKSTVEASIDSLNFSVRSSNALKRSGLMTVNDIISVIENDKLQYIRNLGKKSHNEIKTRILDYGYTQLSEREKALFFENMLKLNSDGGCNGG